MIIDLLTVLLTVWALGTVFGIGLLIVLNRIYPDE
jgi:hypothetical protein